MEMDYSVWSLFSPFMKQNNKKKSEIIFITLSLNKDSAFSFGIEREASKGKR